MSDLLPLAACLVLAVVLARLFPPPSGRVCGCCWLLMRRRGKTYTCPLGCAPSEQDRDACRVHGR